ncbi:MAG: polyprenyl synthetase family protein [Mesoaciditoga sp.]|uniref:polyprenyl synthetase family protein n=1 Tax=Athalassotoga sp. TaxID=2022597 RepID=UPI000CC424DB|nr:MAG: polyprenyl synthetase family protein [Mesoaciditoga sp.]HEU25184.1 polyprenyl synthetase family protein [Mesoaciditoga lauensis]
MKRKAKVKATKEIDLMMEQIVKSFNLSPQLEEAALYTLKLPGKRLRPKLVLASAQDFDVDEEIAMKVACATEMMHAGSLIHDDLPAIDNDSYRRGMPSNHVKFGEDVAIMAGDLLFSIAGYTCTESKNNNVIKAFTRTLIELVNGETMDILMAKSKEMPSKEEILKMYRGKTGSLFAFAFSFGSLMASQDATPYAEAGYSFGIYFQILDDIMDLTATFEQIGKTPRKDIEENKATLVRIIGVEESKKFADNLHGEILSKIGNGHLYKTVKEILG